MSDELLTKKLALYYHPLFQAIVQEWASVFLNGQPAMDIITFIEINLRAQKAILPEIDFENSLSSALNDWIREISSLSQSSARETPAKTKTNEDIMKAVQKILEDFPFELTVAAEDYISFFEGQLDRLTLSYVVDKMSTEGFGKFLFDLCSSWCENLDIELFSFFLLSVFYQTIRFEPFGYLHGRAFEEVYYFPEPLIVQLKLLKTHYARYKKVDLTSYESWYEWNYLPHRINEIKKKILEIFTNIFREDEHVASYLDGLYWSSLQQITQKGLAKPSTDHFTICSKENIEPHSKENAIHEMQNYPPEKDTQPSSKTWNQARKKPPVPLLEHLSNRNVQDEESGQVHTVRSIDPFLSDIDAPVPEDQRLGQLYPIWEHEVSDTTSVATRCSVERETPLKINKKIRYLSREKAKHMISAKKEEKNSSRGNTPVKGTDKSDKLKLVGEPSSTSTPRYFMQNMLLGKLRTTISPRVLDQLSMPQLVSPVYTPKVYSETPNESKSSGNVLCESNQTKHGRVSAPLVKNAVKMSHSSSTLNLRNGMFEESGSNSDLKREIKDRKLMKLFGSPSDSVHRSMTTVKTRHKGRTYKEVSSELNKVLKEDKYDFTIVGKSKLQINDEEDFLVSSRGKYGLDLHAIDVEDHRERSEQRIIERLDPLMWNQTPKVSTSYRAQSTRVNRSPYREYVSPDRKGKTSRGMNKRSTIDSYSQLSNEIRKDTSRHIKLQFPQTTVARTQVRVTTTRQELNPQEIGKNLKDLFGKMKDKLETNRKKQDIRIKRIKRPESKQNTNTQTISQVIL